MKINSNIIADIFGDKYVSINGIHEPQSERVIRVSNGSTAIVLLISISSVSSFSLFNSNVSLSSSSSLVNIIR
jgi:hypothetical protein